MADQEPTGFCECGCQQRTNLAPWTDPVKRWVKGQPLRFIFGHQWRAFTRAKQQEIHRCECGCGTPTSRSHGGKRRPDNPPSGQFHRFAPGHHKLKWNVRYPGKRMRDGSQLKFHRIRAEHALGHPLPPKAIVHHPDCDPENPTARLVICENQKYHFLLHVRMRVKAAGGNPNTDKICSRCRAVKVKTAFPRKRSAGDGLSPWCRACIAITQRERKIRSHGNRR